MGRMLLTAAVSCLCLYMPVMSFARPEGEAASVPHPRIVTTPSQKAATLKLIEENAWAGEVLEALKVNVDGYADKGEDYLSSRLYMNWKTQAKEVYIRGEWFSNTGDGRAPAPTVMFSGARSSATGYARPPISERLPYADETKGVYMKNRNLPGQPLEWVRPDKVGTQIESGNVDIMRCARDAAYLWWLTGEEKYGRMAARVLDTYLQGIYYRDVPVDLNHGHQQTLVGMTSFEVIHEDIVPVLCECYDFLYDYMAAHYADRMPLYADALKKMADVIIRNGVPHNNWNIIQARFVFSIALVLDEDTAYEDGKGRNHYIDVVANDSTLRQWGLKTLADYGFDEGTGIWNECAGYSCNVVHDYTDFVMLFDKYLGRDLAKELPIIERAVAATPQYCFPNRKIVGFGDTHPWLLRTSYFANMVKNAQRYGKRGQEEKFTAMLRCFEPEFTTVQGQPKTDGNLMNLYPQESLMLDTTIAPGRIEAYVSPTFYVPKVSWLVQRNGMDPAHSLMYSLNASEGNHQHANGLSVEFYGKGLTLGPDAGIGKSLYSGLDYLEYYSQFPSHNTVCVDGISSYPVMKSNHSFKLLHCYPAPSNADERNLLSSDYFRGISYSEAYFREPESQSDQTRLLGIVDTDGGNGYYVDIFRSRKCEGGDKMHDYFYHNLGQEMEVTAADGSPLDFAPTEELSFAGAHLYAYSYIYDQQVVETDEDVRVDFTVKPEQGGEEVRMTMWQQGMPGRKIFRALSPETEGLSRDNTMPYTIKGAPTLTYVARQGGEAWTRPFVSVFEPSVASEGNRIDKVAFFTPECATRDAVGIRVTLKGGEEDIVLSSVDSRKEVRHEDMVSRATYVCLRHEGGKLVRMLMGNGTGFKADGVEIRAQEGADVSLQWQDGGWYYTASRPCVIQIAGKSRKVKAASEPCLL